MNATTTSRDRIRLPLQFDAERLRRDVAALDLPAFVYYDSVPLRAPAHLVDASVPFPPPAEDYADGSWTDWLDTPLLRNSNYLREVVDKFRENCTVNLIRLLRLAPGAEVKEHTDPTLGLHVERSMIRLTIPVQVPTSVQFILNGTEVPMRPGECWYLRLTDPHRVLNPSAEERINLTIDVVPNEWVRGLLGGGIS